MISNWYHGVDLSALGLPVKSVGFFKGYEVIAADDNFFATKERKNILSFNVLQTHFEISWTFFALFLPTYTKKREIINDNK